MWSGSWTYVAARPTCLHANFRLTSTDTGDVSTSVEQKPCTPVFLFLLSSGPEPPMFSFPPWFFPPRSYTSLFNLLLASQHGSEGIPNSTRIWRHDSRRHQSHSWVFTVGQIKVLVLRLTLKDVGFTLGWWLWLSRLGLHESMLATQALH